MKLNQTRVLRSSSGEKCKGWKGWKERFVEFFELFSFFCSDGENRKEM